jgi:hypothetical protein
VRGRGHKKIEQGGVVRKISADHGLPIIRLPKYLLEFGFKMNDHVTLKVKSDPNPLNTEIIIKIKPVASIKREELKEPISA